MPRLILGAFRFGSNWGNVPQFVRGVQGAVTPGTSRRHAASRTHGGGAPSPGTGVRDSVFQRRRPESDVQVARYQVAGKGHEEQNPEERMNAVVAGIESRDYVVAAKEAPKGDE